MNHSGFGPGNPTYPYGVEDLANSEYDYPAPTDTRKVEAYRDSQGKVHRIRRNAILADLAAVLKCNNNILLECLSQDRNLRAKVIQLLQEFDGNES